MTSFGVKLVANFLVLFGSVLSARALGPVGRGEFVALITAVALLVQFGGLGLSSAVTLELSRNPARGPDVVATYVSLALAMGGAIALAITGLQAMGGARLDGRTIFFLCVWPVVQLLLLNAQSAFLGHREYGWFNGTELVVRLATVLALIVVIATGHATVIILLELSLGVEAAIALIANALLIRRFGISRRLDWAFVRRLFAVSMRVYGLLVLPFVLVRTDILLLKWWGGAAETGIYSVSAQIVTLMLILPQSVGQILFSAVGHVDSPAEDTRRLTAITFWLLVAAAVCAAATGPLLIPALFGAPYAAAYRFMLLLLPGAILLGTETVVVQYFNIQGFPLRLLGYWTVGAVANIVGNALLIPRYGASAAALTSTIGYGSVSLLVLHRFRRETGISVRQLFTPPRLPTLMSMRHARRLIEPSAL